MNYRQPTLSLCAGYVTGHSAARWSGFTCAGARLSAPGLMPSPLGDHICASKRQRKRTLIEWRTVAGRLCNGNKQEATTQEMMLHNWQGTFTPHRRAAKWKTGYSSVDRGEGRKNRAIVWMFGVRADQKKRCVGKRIIGAERTKVFCLGGKDKRARGQKELCVNRDVASHYNAWGTLGVSV